MSDSLTARRSTVRTAGELAEALASGVTDIEIEGTIAGSPMITLPPGATLRGGVLRFGAKGVRLTSDNTLIDVAVLTADDEVAILNDTTVTDLGTLQLRDVRTTGQVLLVAVMQSARGACSSRACTSTAPTSGAAARLLTLTSPLSSGRLGA